MFVNVLAVSAEFEADLLKMRTREGMAIARSRSKHQGEQPKLSPRQRPSSSGRRPPASTPSLN